jgi:hypothetical protein
MAKWEIKQHEYDAKADNVNHPAHYGQGKIECIDYLEDFLTHEEFIGYLRGNIAKYLHRWRYKNGMEDLKKSQWYLERLVKTMNKN